MKPKNRKPLALPHYKIMDAIYLVSNLFFLVGSFVLFPMGQKFNAIDISGICYIIGLISYLYAGFVMIVSEKRNSLIIKIGNICNFAAPVLFFIGCILYFSTINMVFAGAWCFTIGSIAWTVTYWLYYIYAKKVNDKEAYIMFLCTIGCGVFAAFSVLMLIGVLLNTSSLVLDTFVALGFFSGTALFIVADILIYHAKRTRGR